MAHTSPARTSPSAQLTLSVPVTMRTAAGGPGSPFGPGGPAVPTGPGGPAEPRSPAGPVEPCPPASPWDLAVPRLQADLVGRPHRVRQLGPVGRRVLACLVRPEDLLDQQDRPDRLGPRDQADLAALDHRCNPPAQGSRRERTCSATGAWMVSPSVTRKTALRLRSQSMRHSPISQGTGLKFSDYVTDDVSQWWGTILTVPNCRRHNRGHEEPKHAEHEGKVTEITFEL